MSNQESNGVPDRSLIPGALSEEEYKKLLERLEAEYSPEPTAEELQQWDDLCWAEEDPWLKQHHAGTWVAIHKRQLLAFGDDPEAVCAEVEKNTGLLRYQLALLVIPTDEYSFWDYHASATPHPH